MGKQEIEFRAARRSDAIEKAADRLHLAAELARRRPDERPYVAAIDAALLQRIGRALAALAVKDCNAGVTPRDEKRRERLATEAATIASWYGLSVTCHGDPRGYAMRLHGPDLTRTGWGEGFGVA